MRPAITRAMILAALALGAAIADHPAWAAPADLEARERSIITQIDQFDRQAATLNIRRRELTDELAELNREQNRDQGRAARLAKKQAGLQDRLAVRLRALYAHGRAGRDRLYALTDRLGDLLFLRQALIRATEFDIRLITEYNNLKSELAESARRRASRQKRIEAYAERLTRAEARLAEQRRARAELLLRIDKEKRVQEEAVRELEEASTELNRELAELEQTAPVGPAMGKLEERKGALPWPVMGRLRRMDNQSRPGIMILAPEGRPVRAVGKGKVIYSGWVRGYGLVVIIDHGQRYYTLSAHLEDAAVEVGQEVAPGQMIGRLGRAGLSDAGVYFEIRHKDRALDPVRWLAGAGQPRS